MTRDLELQEKAYKTAHEELVKIYQSFNKDIEELYTVSGLLLWESGVYICSLLPGGGTDREGESEDPERVITAVHKVNYNPFHLTLQ